jgi:thioredoxin reductase
MVENIVIVGGGPAAYMCAIYSHTANLSPVVINIASEQTYEFGGSNKVAAVLDCETPREFSRLVREQSQNMGIRVYDERVIEITRDGVLFSIKTEDSSYTCRALVIDDAEMEDRYKAVLGEAGVFYTSKFVPCREAIVIAAAGCKTSFDVKEYLNA